jgi:hypothetical protein
MDVVTGDTYINIHTAANTGGEIRGQVRPNQLVVTAVEPVDAEVPSHYLLGQNYPNPFNPTTTIDFSLPEASHAILAVYNVLGQEVARLVDDSFPAGQYRVTFDARDFPSGVYSYRLEAGSVTQVRSMLLVK